MFSDRFRYTIKDTFKKINFTGDLYLDENDFVLAVPGLDIHSVKLVVTALLVSLAFENINNMDSLTE